MSYVTIAIVFLVVLGPFGLAFVWNFQRGSVYDFSSEPVTPKSSTVGGFQIAKIHAGDGTELTVLFAVATSKDTVILSFYGNFASALESAARMIPFVEDGYGVAIMVYRGANSTPGSPNESAFKADALSVYDQLAEVFAFPVHGHKIVVHGFSLGVSPAVHLAGQRQVAGVVLEGSYDRLCRFQQQRFKGVIPMCQLMWRERHDVVDEIDDVTAPILFAHGAQDAAIPIAWARDLYSAASAPKDFKEYDPGTHTNLMDQGLADDMVEFVSSL